MALLTSGRDESGSLEGRDHGCQFGMGTMTDRFSYFVFMSIVGFVVNSQS